jgi:hypothetical protein
LRYAPIISFWSTDHFLIALSVKNNLAAALETTGANLLSGWKSIPGA